MNNLCILLLLLALVTGQSGDEISNSSFPLQENQQESLHGARKTVEAFSGEAGSWSPSEALMSINYENYFRVSVYEKIPKEVPDKRHFYYTPALIIDPNSAVSFFSNFTKRHEMIFSVLMWDEAFEKFVRDEISQELNVELSCRSVSVLPIEEIRIDSEEQTEGYQIINRWTPYANQPSIFEFVLVCGTKSDCDQVADNAKANPKQFVHGFTVYYGLQNGRVFGEKDNVPGKIQREQVKITRLSAEFSSRINVLGSFSSRRSILDYRAEVYRMKNELLAKIETLNSTLNLPCIFTAYRVTGGTVEANSANATNGVVCVGNTRSPSPSHNFLVFNKVGSRLNFFGTQSLRKGFIDFTPYVTWSVAASQTCSDVEGCDQLPNHLRGLIKGGYDGYCSRNSPSGSMLLACYSGADTLVDDDGAITVLNQDTATLWY